jgi:hypothetical protein
VPVQLLWTLWCPKLQLFVQPHNKSKVQNFELFVQTFHFHGPFDSMELKQICTLLLLPPFLTCWVFILLHRSEHYSSIVASDLVILAQLFVKVQVSTPLSKLNLWDYIFNLTIFFLKNLLQIVVHLYASLVWVPQGIIDVA